MTLRNAFSIAILLLASAYTWIAFTELAFMDRWRPGPGFFPRVIGILTIVLTAYSLVVDARKHASSAGHGTKYMRDLLVFFAYCIGFVALFPLLGGLLSMIVFMLAALFTFNRGATLVNLAVSVALPFGLFLLFDVWLNAAFAPGRIPLPW